MSSDKIAMCDLKGQYEKIKTEVDSAIQNVLSSTAFVKGKDVGDFQDELAKYIGAKHVIGCANGTDALQIALMALGLKPGDEVITPDFTFIATVEVVALLGLTPVLVDVEPDTYTISPEQLERAITSKTKAIIPVHLFGQCANMDAIMRIANKHGIPVVEDTAQALGARYTFADGTTRMAGTIGQLGTTSFFPSKNLGCYGDGGAIFTNDDALADEIRAIANHGMRVRYHHDRIGVNSRLDTIQAAILRVKLKHLDAYNQARIAAADYYDSRFANCSHLITPKRNPQSTHIFHQYTMCLQDVDREKFIEHLADRGIPSMVYYPIPLHNQKAFVPYAHDGLHFPVSTQLAQTVLSLPMHTEFTPEKLRYVADNVLDYFK